MLTYQDFLEAEERGKREEFLLRAIRDHKNSDIYKTAVVADTYDHQENDTISKYVKTIMQLTGIEVRDFTASNAKIASNFFNRLNTQRCTYSLGNGTTFTDHTHKEVDKDGSEVTVDETKDVLGKKWDTDLKNICYFGLIHGLSFGFWNVNRLHLYKVTEFVPMWDEDDGRLRAGIRFWQLDPKKPMVVELYEEDGRTKYRTSKNDSTKLEEVEEKKPYKTIVQKAPADPEEVVVGEENYGTLPVVPFWGSRLHQSTLVGMQQGIDSYDLVRSGFANDLNDISQIFWIVENCNGMSPEDLAKFRDTLKLTHIATADTSEGGRVTPYSQDIPHEARETFLNGIRSDIYESFGGLDVHTIAAGATNDHIDAAYQPMDEEADDFEFQVIEFVQQVLSLLGIDDTPEFKRNRISNQKEQTEMLVLVRDDLDRETFLKKLPFITPDEVVHVMKMKDAEEGSRYEQNEDGPSGPDETIEEVDV